jgi:hypothetical protein
MLSVYDVQPKPLKAIAFINQTSQSATMPMNPPVPTSPLWLLGIMAGLLSLVGMSKLRKT